MQYKIRSFNPTTGQIEVEFADKWVFSIDLPIKDSAFPVGAELEQVIQNFAPTYMQERYDLLAAGVNNIDAIAALVEPFPEVPVTTASVETTFDVTSI